MFSVWLRLIRFMELSASFNRRAHVKAKADLAGSWAAQVQLSDPTEESARRNRCVQNCGEIRRALKVKMACRFLFVFGAVIQFTIGTVNANIAYPASVATSADQVQTVRTTKKDSGLLTTCKAWKIIEAQAPIELNFCNCTPMNTAKSSRPSLRNAKRKFTHSC